MPEDVTTNPGGVGRPYLVEMIYDVLVHPEKLEHLFFELSALYDVGISRGPGGAAGPHDPLLLTLEGIETHLDQVAALFERLGREYRSADVGETAQADDVIWLDRFGAIQDKSGSAARMAASSPPASVFDLQIDSDVAVSLRAQLAALARLPVFSVIPVHNPDGSRTYWSLTGLREPRQNAVAELRRMNFGWSDAAGQVVVDAFSLTPSERDILRFVVDGKSLTELARVRGRSIETVRTQAKALLTKTGVRSQLELVRMFAAVSLAAPDVKPAAANAADRRIRGNSTVRASDGRDIGVEVCGPPAGRPVLFLHNMFGGPAMTAGVIAELERLNIRLICPWRPGYFESTRWQGGPRDLPQAVADDLERVLDSYGIGRTIVVGHMSGAVHAAAAAALLPERVAGAIAVAGFVPFVDHRMFNMMANWPRIFAYTARYVPAAMAVLIRGTMALLREGMKEVFFNGLFQTSQADRATIGDPEISHIFQKEAGRAMMHSTAGYEMDVVLAASDWSQWFQRPAGKAMQFIHGEADHVTTREQVSYVAARFDNLKPVFVPDAGSLLLFQKPALVVGLIAELLDERVGR